MANIASIKVRKTNTVYGIQDAAASLAIEQMKNGTDIDSFGDVETALDGKVSKSNTAGLLKNDGTVDQTSYATAASVNAIKDGTDIDSFGDVETALDDKLDVTRIAPEFQDDVAYTTGQYVTRNGFIYRFKNNHSAGAFNPQEVFGVTIGDVLADKEYITNYNSGDFTVITGEDSTTGYTTNTVSLNKASTPTQSDTKPITSDGVYNYAFPRSEQEVLGAKNVGEIILGYYVQEATTGYFKLTADANAITYIAKVEQNTDYRCKKDAYGDRFAVTGFVNYPSTTTTTAEASRLFDDSSATEHVVNTGIYNYLAFTANRTTEVAESSVKGMIYLASDPDSTYVPYAMTNAQLTKMLQVTETVVTTSNPNVTLDNALNKVYKYGRIVYGKVRFTLASAWGSSVAEIFNVHYKSLIPYPIFQLTNRSAPYNVIPEAGVYLDHTTGSVALSYNLPAGSYDITFSYISAS